MFSELFPLGNKYYTNYVTSKKKGFDRSRTVQWHDHNLPECGLGQVAGNTSNMPCNSEHK